MLTHPGPPQPCGSLPLFWSGLYRNPRNRGGGQKGDTQVCLASPRNQFLRRNAGIDSDWPLDQRCSELLEDESARVERGERFPFWFRVKFWVHHFTIFYLYQAGGCLDAFFQEPTRSPSSALLSPFLVGRVPQQKQTTDTSGYQLILTSQIWRT